MTPKQEKLLRFIEYKVSSTGKAPTYAEMRYHMGVRSNQAIKDWLNILEQKRFITIDKGSYRGLKPTKKAEPITLTSSIHQSTMPEIRVQFSLANNINSAGDTDAKADISYGNYSVESI